MWDADIDTLDAGRTRRVGLSYSGKAISYAEAVEHWQSDKGFCTFFKGLLSEAPYRAYLWETPPVTAESMGRSFEFVLVDSPFLAELVPDPHSFASHFEEAGPQESVVAFPNLGGDAFLIAPTPQDPRVPYPHLAAFARNAPCEHWRAYWQVVGSAFAARLGAFPLWLSTNGLGVAWLHARIDTRPKYYSFVPYRTVS